MKVGVIIPDCGDRPLFLAKCLQYLERQTFQDYTLRLVNEKLPESIKGIDIAYRYHIGFRDLFEKSGCDVVIAIESDDWYSPNYLEVMIREWEKAGQPDVCGLERSIYYHVSGQYAVFNHHGRASMNATMVTSKVLTAHKYDYKNPYLDAKLWANRGLTRKTFKVAEPLVVGIKHGSSMVGGAGHGEDWVRYTYQDRKLAQLEKWIGQDAAFYRIMAVKDNYTITKKQYCESEPVLSIVTRMHGDRRPGGFKKNQDSVISIEGDLEQVFIHDKKGLGVYYANMSFQLAVNDIAGRWVMALDDDDFMNNNGLINDILKIEKEHNPDVIIGRCIILNGAYNNYYPSPKCWADKRPIIAQIGGSCIIVKKEIYLKFIHHFGRIRCGDFHFMNEIYNSRKYKWYWMDKLIAETGRVSHGKTEI